MALSYPLDLLNGWPGWSTEFDLLWRQEQSRTAGGRTRVKDFGSPLWRSTYLTRSLNPNELDEWRARLASLENGIHQFRGIPLSRCRPIAHPGSGALPAGSLHTIGPDRRSIRVSGLTGISLRVGDFIRVGTADLHQVMETAVAVAGLTPLFEVRPHIWPGIFTGAPVSIVRPYCLMTVVPGSVSSTADLSTGHGTVSFQAIEAR